MSSPRKLKCDDCSCMRSHQSNTSPYMMINLGIWELRKEKILKGKTNIEIIRYSLAGFSISVLPTVFERRCVIVKVIVPLSSCLSLDTL